ncbi:MAG: META domain-containing protein [Gelidibacter sp.]
MNYITTLILSVVFFSCGTTKDMTTNNQEAMNKRPTETLNGIYTITQLGVDTSLPSDLTLEFDKKTNRVSGFSGCNRFSASYKTEGNILTIGNVMATKRACQGEINVIEHHFFKLLANVQTFSVKENTLILKQENNVLIAAEKSQKTVKTVNKVEKTVQNNTTVSYQALSRGFFEKIWITQDSITVSSDRNLKEKQSFQCPEKAWNELMIILDTIAVKSMPNLESPTQARFYDGAAIASLTITQNGFETKSSAFDHGNPPEAIKALVDKVISIKEMAVKQ